MQELLAAKIREFEKTSSEEKEKSTKALKNKASKAAKAKKSEGKALVADANITDEEKLSRLMELIEKESAECTTLAAQTETRYTEIADAERERDACQAELHKTIKVKNQLETLCRQLRTQTQELIDERKHLSDQERQRRQGLADEFSATIGDVKKQMDEQAAERARLAQENEDLRSRFKVAFDQYDKRDIELNEQQTTRAVEVKDFEARLTEQAQLYRQEAQREQEAQAENDQLLANEQALRSQLQTYTAKFSSFKDALSRSDKVLGQYKRQRNKMQVRLETLQKENREMGTKNSRKMAQLTKERDSALREKVELQERAKQLQAERQQLSDQIAKLKAEKGEA